MTQLFLLKPDFKDTNLNDGIDYFCPECAMVEGILKYYPQIKEQLEIIYVDFQKPRQAVIDMLGTENQGCPVLIIEKKQDEKADTSYFQSSGDKKFVNNLGDISKYLAEAYKVGLMHS